MRTVLVFLFLYFATVSLIASSAKGKLSPHRDTALTRTYNWIYDSCEFNLKIAFNKSDYIYYRRKSKHVTTEQSYVRFATEDGQHPYYSHVLHHLDSIAKGCNFNESEFAGFVIAFVQQAISYKKDPFNWGADYPRYGIETLVDHHGDCEDMACLLIGLLRSVNYDVVLIAIPGHMAVGLSCEDCDGRCYELNEHAYYFLESTGPENTLGYEDDKMIGRTHNLYNVPQTAVFNHQFDSITNRGLINMDSLKCTFDDCSYNKTKTSVISKSTKPSTPYGNGFQISSNIGASKSQPKNIIRLSDVRVSGTY